MSKTAWARKARSISALRARLELLAAERAIHNDEIRKAQRSTKEMLAFANRHELSIDWLYLGDLKGLHRMAEWSRQPGSYAATGCTL
jgi:hypothetical protein